MAERHTRFSDENHDVRNDDGPGHTITIKDGGGEMSKIITEKCEQRKQKLNGNLHLRFKNINGKDSKLKIRYLDQSFT